MLEDQAGYSLTEIIIALALSLSLVFMVLEILISIRQTYQINEALLSMQQNAVIASQLLARDIRSAGFFGCARLNGDLLQQLASHSVTQIASNVQGFDSANVPDTYRELTPPVYPGTDAIVLEKIADPVFQLNEIRQRSIFEKNEWLILVDCNEAALIRCPLDHANAEQLISAKNFSENEQVGALLKAIYYIGNTGRASTSGNTILALYRKNELSMKQQQTELVDNIENMQIRYGIQNINDGEVNYVPAGLVSDWKKVVSAQIHLLMVSSTEISAKPQVYQFMDSNWTARDRRLRMEWITTIALRNALSRGVSTIA
jgi:type IV pilus assembly protein PilW